MSIAFAVEVAHDDSSVVETVFNRPVALRNEAHGEAKVPAGQLAVIANYRAYVGSNKGKKARGAGEAVLDLSAVSRIPARELPALIARLEELAETLTEGVAAANEI